MLSARTLAAIEQGPELILGPPRRIEDDQQFATRIAQMARNDAIREAAAIAGEQQASYDGVLNAHYRHSAAAFMPDDYGFDMEVVKWSKDSKVRILSLLGGGDRG